MSVRRRVKIMLALVGVLALAIGVPTAISVFSGFNGGQSLSIFTKQQDATGSKAGLTFTNVPGSNISLVVPARATRLIVARWTAETVCFQSQPSGLANYCSARIMAFRAGSPPVELAPVAGINYALDSTDLGRESSSSWEGHAMERVRRLTAGNWTLFVQVATTSATTVLQYDDWNFSVEFRA